MSPATSFLRRLVVYSVAMLTAGTLVHLLADTGSPLLYLSADLIPIAMIGSVVFIALVAHEIIAGFITLITGGFYKSKSLNHFLILSVIYLLNLWFAYAHKMGWVNWDFYLHPLVVLFISSLLAVWGIRRQSPQYDNIIDADPFAVYGILALGLLTWSLVSYLQVTANDPGLSTISDLSLYAHLGYGMMFVIYVIGNFINLLGNNMAVYKVLYQPEHMPFFTYRFAGLIATLGFVFVNFWMRPINDTMAAYHNAVADLYLSRGEVLLAEGYYKSGVSFGTYNHHGNYAIANIEVMRNNRTRAIRAYDNATSRRPTEMAFLNQAELLRQQGDKLQSLQVLEEAARAFPRSAHVWNSLGYTYMDLHVADSAALAFRRARRLDPRAPSSAINYTALLAVRDAPLKADSLLTLYDGDKGAKANILALANRQHVALQTSLTLPADSMLSVYDAVLAQNFLLQGAGQDTAIVRTVWTMAGKKQNSSFREQLRFACAMAWYQLGMTGSAITAMQDVALNSLKPERYNNILAQWALEQRAPSVALTYTRFALQQNPQEAQFLNAVALTEAHRTGEAIVAWDSLQRKKTSKLRSLAESMVRVLALPSEQLGNLSGNEPFSASLYRFGDGDSIAFKKFLRQLSSDDQRAKAILERCQRYFDRDELLSAIVTFQLTSGLQLSDRNLLDDIRHFELLMLADRRELNTIAQQINNQQLQFGPDRLAEKIYLAALLDVASGKSTDATAKFQWLVREQPLFSPGVVAAADFMRQQSRDKQLDVYKLLAAALHRHPHSVRILKAYIAEARAAGFDEYADSAAATLQFVLEHE
ncbi:MAG: hypothetical protein U0V64_15425 [Cyclobacteriaceae bacterium]